MPRRPHARPLTRDLVVQEALRIVDTDGLAALSMRKLAAALDVDPMATYYHVPGGKNGLVRLLVAAVLADLAVPEATGAWETRVKRWAGAYCEAVLAHPNLLLQVVSQPDAIAGATAAANESLQMALRDGGLVGNDVTHAAALVVDFVNGYALGVATAGAEEAAGDFDLQAYFDFGVDTIVAGIAAIAARDSA